VSDVDGLDLKIQHLDLKEGDVLVVSAKQPLPERVSEFLRARLSAVAPGHRIMVLDGGLQLSVLTAAQIKARTEIG
jgi:hypothetical protein